MIRIGLYGVWGHQLPVLLPAQVRARVTAVANYPATRLDEALGADSAQRRALKEYTTLQEMLADPDIDLVSLCSPNRGAQAEEAITCLQAGKHVLAEKPAAFTDAALDEILATSQRTGKLFREMADSMLEPPVLAIRRLVDAGELGAIVHVQAHKSYPWLDGRPQDHHTDGGLVRQVGIHAARFIIAATGLKITTVTGDATGLGNPGSGNIHMAAAFTCMLENGGIAAMNLNYLNPRNFGVWGNDQLRVFGTRGMAESVDGFQRNRLFLDGRESTDLPLPTPPISTCYIEHYANLLLDGTPMPSSHAEEVAAQRAIITAYQSACSGRRVQVKLE